VTVQTVAAEAEQIVESVMKVEPTVATVAGMFVPGAAPVVAVVQPAVLLAAPFVEKALSSIAAGNGGDAMSAFIELLQHLTAGQPNSAALTNAQPNTASASAQGSG